MKIVRGMLCVHNIAVDRQGNLSTSEANTGQRIQKFRRVDRQDRGRGRTTVFPCEG